MNTVNKLFTFCVVLISNAIGPEGSLIFWACFCILGVIPAYFVKEDFRRLNMKDVEKSVYVFERNLLNKT